MGVLFKFPLVILRFLHGLILEVMESRVLGLDNVQDFQILEFYV
jgi:hypothetical protein